jgi:hypothetical protein
VIIVEEEFFSSRGASQTKTLERTLILEERLYHALLLTEELRPDCLPSQGDEADSTEPCAQTLLSAPR